MFGLGFWEIALVLGVALLVFGPAKLPELARSLGRGLREFRKATEDFKSTMDAELHAPEDRPSPSPAAPEKLPDTVARAPSYGVEPAELEPHGSEGSPSAAPVSATETSESQESSVGAAELASTPEPSAPEDAGDEKPGAAPSSTV